MPSVNEKSNWKIAKNFSKARKLSGNGMFKTLVKEVMICIVATSTFEIACSSNSRPTPRWFSRPRRCRRTSQYWQTKRRRGARSRWPPRLRVQSCPRTWCMHHPNLECSPRRTITVDVGHLWGLARLARWCAGISKSSSRACRALGVVQATSCACLARDTKESLVVCKGETTFGADSTSRAQLAHCH